jgi:flagellar biosynthesis protein FlhF
MQIKHFQAATMAEALERVKRELGPEAVILSACSRKNGKGLFGPFKKAGVEVTAAGNGPLAPSETDRSRTDAEKVTINRGSYPAAARRLARPKMTARISYSTPHAPVRPPVERMSPNRRDIPKETDGPAGFNHHRLYRCLLNQGVEKAYAREMVAEVRPPGGIADQEPGNASLQLAGILEKIGVAAQPPVLESGQQRCIAVVGATGVGKTTAISKLAAEYAVDGNLRVAMISLDNIRVAASNQLQALADIIGVPLEVAADRAGLDSALDKFRQHDLILIDTPGLCFRNASHVDVLSEWFDAMGPLEVHLLLSATSRWRDNLDLYERLDGIRVNRLMFSKVDETFYYGDILNLLLRLQIPVSFFFDGAAGPDGVKKAKLNVLADFLGETMSAQNRLYAPEGDQSSRRLTRPVPMRWLPLADEIDASPDSEAAATGDRVETERGGSRSGFFRFNGKNKRVTTA